MEFLPGIARLPGFARGRIAGRARTARGNAPEAARPIDVIAVGNVEYVATIAAPYRADLVIEGTIVIARQIAFAFAGEPLDVRELPVDEVARENVKPAAVLRGHEGQAGAVRRDPRLEVHGAVAGERT